MGASLNTNVPEAIKQQALEASQELGMNMTSYTIRALRLALFFDGKPKGTRVWIEPPGERMQELTII